MENIPWNCCWHFCKFTEIGKYLIIFIKYSEILDKLKFWREISVYHSINFWWAFYQLIYAKMLGKKNPSNSYIYNKNRGKSIFKNRSIWMFFKNIFQRSYLVFHRWKQNFTGRELKAIEFYELKDEQIVKHFHMHIFIDLFSYIYIYNYFHGFN